MYKKGSIVTLKQSMFMIGVQVLAEEEKVIVEKFTKWDDGDTVTVVDRRGRRHTLHVDYVQR